MKYLIAMDGREFGCKGISTIELTANGLCLMAEAIVINKMIKDIDVVIELNLIEHLNGVFFDKGIGNLVRCNVHGNVQLE